MPLTNSQYSQIQRIYEKKQLEHQRILSRHLSYVNENIPGFEELSHSLSSLCLLQAQKLLDGDESALNNLKQEIETVRRQKRELLAKASLPDGYLTLTYDCKDCKDTGYIDGEKCHCFRLAASALLYDQSNIRDLLKKQDFSKVSNKYYKGTDLLHFENSLEKSQNFAKNFKNDYQNLIFYGTVGTGKSFLSGCIANELIKNGHSVLYFSSSALLDNLSKYSFDYKNKDEWNEFYQNILDCDLLIIDDLGTELTNAFTLSQIFTCLNERYLRKKSIIISTNLSLEELRDRYSDRIFSRLTGNFIFCLMSGPDIRML